jgi:hypothetical protein
MIDTNQFVTRPRGFIGQRAQLAHHMQQAQQAHPQMMTRPYIQPRPLYPSYPIDYRGLNETTKQHGYYGYTSSGPQQQPQRPSPSPSPMPQYLQPSNPYPNFQDEQLNMHQMQSRMYNPVPKQFLPEMSIQKYQPGNEEMTTMSNPYIKQRGVVGMWSYDNYPTMLRNNGPPPAPQTIVPPQPQQPQQEFVEEYSEEYPEDNYNDVPQYYAPYPQIIQPGQEVYMMPPPNQMAFAPLPSKYTAGAPTQKVYGSARPVFTATEVIDTPITEIPEVKEPEVEKPTSTSTTTTTTTTPNGKICTISTLVGDSPSSFWSLIAIIVFLMCIVGWLLGRGSRAST